MLAQKTLWRLMHRSRGLVECVLRNRRDGRCSLCVMGGREPSLEVFNSAGAAVRRAADIADTLREQGWRLVYAAEPFGVEQPVERARRRITAQAG